MLDAQERHWRQVPKVNVLPARASVLQKTLVLRVLLALIIILGLYLVWDQMGSKSDLDDLVTQKSGQLRSLQRELGTKQQGLDAIQGQINQLRDQRAASEQAFQLITGDNLDWYGAFADLFEAESLGVIFLSVAADPAGKVSIQGQTTAEVPLASLPSQLSSISDVLDFQSFQSDPSSEPPTFSATFQVRQ